MNVFFVAVIERELTLPEGILLSRDTKQATCIGRYICYRYLHEEQGWSANRIARLFQRSRNNIFRGIRLLRHQMEFNDNLRHHYSNLIEKMEGATEIAAPSEE